MVFNPPVFSSVPKMGGGGSVTTRVTVPGMQLKKCPFVEIGTHVRVSPTFCLLLLSSPALSQSYNKEGLRKRKKLEALIIVLQHEQLL